MKEGYLIRYDPINSWKTGTSGQKDESENWCVRVNTDPKGWTMLRPSGKPNHFAIFWDGFLPATKRSSEDVEFFLDLLYIENKSPPNCSWGFQKHTTDPHWLGDPAVTRSNWPHLDLLQLDHPSTTILESRILTGSGVYTPPPPPATAANQLQLYGLPSRCDTFSAVLFYDGSSSIPCQARNDKYAAFV